MELFKRLARGREEIRASLFGGFFILTIQSRERTLMIKDKLFKEPARARE